MSIKGKNSELIIHHTPFPHLKTKYYSKLHSALKTFNMSKPKFLLFVGGLLCIVLIIQSTSALPTVDPELKTFFSKGESQNHQYRYTDIIISMNESNSKPLEEIASRTFKSREERLNSITASLEEFSSKSQKNVLNFLNQKKLEREYRNADEHTTNIMKIQPLWISNQIIVRSADLSLVEELQKFEEIRAVDKDKIYQLLPYIQSSSAQSSSKQIDGDFPWGIKAIDAPSVWKRGNCGQGVVVATIDSGVRLTHEALRDNYVGKYGWYDPIDNTKEPNNQDGHGTHVMGTIVGNKRNIGVAPRSKWMACKACGPEGCFGTDLSLCGQWIQCPTDGANNRNCSQAPNLVSNSWGGKGGRDFYDGIIKAWTAGEIIPIFAIGNSGEDCKTASSPGDRKGVIGVGATTINNITAFFSSRGPTIDDGRIKPDVAAPGVDIVSASASSDSGYVSYQGTSMACPHVSGLVALLLAEKNNTLNFEQVRKALCKGAGPVKSQGETCGGIPDTKYPNNQVGCGQIHALRSVLYVKENYP